ncbi:MAG TPA: DUF2911 domain-containing protein [Vicinamibacterales bacterium]|jgi:hypothetical protein|nr:DUF2911 domain-containing protein [Vicinamibacterales bacterium]
MRIWKTVATLTAIAACAATVAQGQEQRKSPHETVKATIDGATITVEYGRPSMKGRKVMGELVPFGKVWRTGADEATTLTTDKELQIGGTIVPAGKYTLFTLPGQTDWQLIVNKQTGQWGTEYDQKQDLGRVPLKKTATSAPVEQLTISVDKNPAGGGLLRIAWENTALTAPITVRP